MAPPLNSIRHAPDVEDDDTVNADSATPARGAGGVTVKPVANAIRILRYLSQTGAPERGADIARHLSINPSTCFNILRTLVAEDVIDFNPLSKMYSAGLGLAKLVDQLITQGQRIELAKPFMEELAAKFHVTVTLWRRMGTDRIVLVSSEASPTDLRIDMPTGQRLPLLMGASGRLFAGQLGLSESEARQRIRHDALVASDFVRDLLARSGAGPPARLGGGRWLLRQRRGVGRRTGARPGGCDRLHGVGGDDPRSPRRRRPRVARRVAARHGCAAGSDAFLRPSTAANAATGSPTRSSPR